MWVWPPHGLPDVADNLNKPPGRGTIGMWLRGVLVALFPTIYGIRCLLAGGTTILGRGGGGWVTLTGWPGMALAITFISLGCLMHFHYFWSAHPALVPYSELGKLISLIAFAGSLIFGSLVALVFG